MPQSVTVAAFIFGIVFLLAALIGKELEIVAIKMPPLSRRLRVILGAFGALLIYVGLVDPFSQTEPSPTAEPSLTPTNSLVPTNTLAPTDTHTPIPTFTPTPTPSPIACGDSRIAPGIFEQLRNETTPSFADSSGAVTFECEGVYDLFNTMPPAVRINYEAVADSFAFFGISIPEGFDVSGFSEICVWVYAEVLEQQFDLKLEDINVGEGVEISTTETNEWAQHCVSLLEGYPNVDLSSISVITLSFNDSFGSARVWIDDFELK